MNLISKFLKRTEFDSYEDFYKNAAPQVPPKFNFGYDVVDEYARLSPDKRAIVWCNSKGDERVFTFKDVSEISNRIVNWFISFGIKKRRLRYDYAQPQVGVLDDCGCLP